MKIAHLALVSLGVGILLIALSFFWTGMIGSVVWNEQQAREHSQASAELHRLSHRHGPDADHGSGAEGEHEARSLEEARERYENSNAKLQQARAYRSGTARLLKWLGAFLAFLGGVGYLLLARPAAG
ncbi:MAG: hypothetical protein ACYSWU_19295, partial [Planctomycetota bacterium]|jgi:hypothetical protein